MRPYGSSKGTSWSSKARKWDLYQGKHNTRGSAPKSSSDKALRSAERGNSRRQVRREIQESQC